MVTVGGLGTENGAVYKPAAEIVPTVEFPPGMPFTLQFPAVFDEPVTVAVNCRVADAATAALAGSTLTVIGAAAVIVKLTDPLVVPPRPVLVTMMGTFVP